MSSIPERLVHIRAQIDAARARSDDTDRDVTIVAVTKHRPADIVDAVAAAGVSDIGENRVMEAVAKASAVEAPVIWHLIGHLQRNKAARAAGLFRYIHSVDSSRLIDALARTGGSLGVFLQINVSGEAAKSGVPPEQARALWRAALNADGLDVCGLMTMAAFSEDPEDARPVFRALRQLRDDLVESGDGPPFSGLSMGMSGDYVVAVEEGATHVRIGTALVGQNLA